MFGDKRLDLNVIHPIAGYFVKPTPTNPNIIVGDFSYIAVSEFESHVKHHYEWTGDKLIIGYKDQGINTNGTAFCFFGGRTLYVLTGNRN
jgi:virginiamycin A acetyltransferase